MSWERMVWQAYCGHHPFNNYFSFTMPDPEKEKPMTSKDDLLREGRELLKKGQELLDKAEALSKPEPVTACVGDEVKRISGPRLYISAPPTCDGAILCMWSKGSSQYIYPQDLYTLDGRKIDRVVPFRIRKSFEGNWPVVGDPSWARSKVRGELATVKNNAVITAKALWPWYDGPAYVVEE